MNKQTTTEFTRTHIHIPFEPLAYCGHTILQNGKNNIGLQKKDNRDQFKIIPVVKVRSEGVSRFSPTVRR